MKHCDLEHPPKLLTHHIPLRMDCLARLTLPVDITQSEAKHLARWIGALVLPNASDSDEWPYLSSYGDGESDVADEEDELLNDPLELDTLNQVAIDEEDQLEQFQRDIEDYDRQSTT